jgi:hypothetical protein
MALPLLLFAALLVWHSSPLLVAVNLLAIAGAISLGALRRTAPRVGSANVSDYAAGAAAAGAASLTGAVALMQHDVPWADLGRRARGRQALAVGRGLAIGAPLLLLFGALFVAADAVFKNLLLSAAPNLHGIGVHVVLIGVVGWLSAGLLRDLLATREDERVAAPALGAVGRRSFGVGATELAVALAVVDLLFAAFVAVQFRYLFGGSGLVAARVHLTYAQYARHGFFELVAVSVLVLPLLLGANALVRGNVRGVRYVRGLSGALVALVLVVIASALDRMWLYERGYGLTELRIYATGVILWLACVFIWLLATVLRGHARTFATGAVVAGFAATIALNVLNPDALIARTNLSRPHVDAAYVGSLSDDAVPSLLTRLPALPEPLRSRVALSLLHRNEDGGGFFGWNESRAHAQAALASHHAELVRYAGP